MPNPIFRFGCAMLLLSAAFAARPAACETLDPQTHDLAHGIFKQLIEINTTDSVGNVTTAARAMQQRFLQAGFSASDMYLGGPNDRKQNLVVRLRGSGAKKPILIIGHLDVVEAPRDEWHTDPFKFVEKDGYYYGRGTQDMKDSDAIVVTNFIRLKKEGYKPNRDLILALTADEEGGKYNGVSWLLKTHPDLVRAEYVLNPDGGGVDLVDGKAVDVFVDASEKMYGDFQLTVTNPGGHSSLPVPDNAIYHLANALVRLQHHQFPFELNEVTRAYFKRLSTVETGRTAADLEAILKPRPDPAAIARLSAQDPEWNSMMHTTCVATRLDAGLANNALPQRAQAIVNCRILPGYTLAQIRNQLVRVFADSKVTVRYMDDCGHRARRDSRAQAIAAGEAERRGDGGDGQDRGPDVAGCARHSDHGRGRVGRHLHDGRPHTVLRHLRSCDRDERRSRARARRASRGRVVLPGRDVLLSIAQGTLGRRMTMGSKHLVDPELLAALDALPPLVLSAESLPAVRSAAWQFPEDPNVADAVDSERRVVPGPAGCPDVGVLIHTPRRREAPDAVRRAHARRRLRHRRRIIARTDSPLARGRR